MLGEAYGWGMSDVDREAAAAWMAYMDRVRDGEITLQEANRLADGDPATNPDLERHGLAWRLNGIPMYDHDDETDEDVIVGVVIEPEWQWDDLTDDQRATLKAKAAEMAASADISPDSALQFLVGEMGVSCPHRWIDHIKPHMPPWRECANCRISEMLSGIVVEIGDRVVRVSDPPPPTFRIPRPVRTSALVYVAEPGNPPEMSTDYDEYRWDGRRYVREG